MNSENDALKTSDENPMTNEGGRERGGRGGGKDGSQSKRKGDDKLIIKYANTSGMCVNPMLEDDSIEAFKYRGGVRCEEAESPRDQSPRGEGFEGFDDCEGFEEVIKGIEGCEGSRGEEGAPSNSRLMSGFLVLNSMIGSGIFNQPYVFSRSGAGSAILLLTLTSVFVWLGMVAMIETGIHANTYDFGHLGHACLGRFGGQAVDISIIFTGVGSIMSYITVIGHLASTLLGSWGWGYAADGGIYLVTTVLILGCTLPFCVYRSFGHFAFISVLSMGSVACILLLIVIAGPIISKNNVASTKDFISSSALGQLGSIIFALNCAPSVFPTFKYIESSHKNSVGWRKIAFFSVLSGYLAILIMGLGGYLVFGDNTEEIIVTNFKGHYADVFKILVIVHLILYTPLDFVILRHSILKVLGVQSGVLQSKVLHLIASVVILGGTYVSSCPLNQLF